MMPNGHPAPQPAGVTPAPTPVVVNVAQVQLPDGTHAVMLQLLMLTGQTVVFLDPDGAREIARNLGRYAGQAKAGLIVPEH